MQKYFSKFRKGDRIVYYALKGAIVDIKEGVSYYYYDVLWDGNGVPQPQSRNFIEYHCQLLPLSREYVKQML